MALSAGQRVSHYEVVSRLGAGGMGEVYRAVDTRLGREVALKVLPEGETSSEQLERFQREARAASSLNHPNICTIYDVSSNPPFIAMELLEGETLDHLLANGPLPVVTIVEIVLPVLDALETAHRKNIVHRDIKPANIFVTERGPKILDFGLAKLAHTAIDAANEPTRASDPHLTDAGRTLGTLAYMSPEQLRGHQLDQRTDLFSFGVVLYAAATGTLPFRGTHLAIVDAILNHAPAQARGLNPQVSPQFEAVIDKCLEKDPALRYQRAADIAADLRRLGRSTASHSSARRTALFDSTPPSRWPWAVATAAAIAAIGLTYALTRPAVVLTDTDTIVLAEFTNTTGDAVFDETLRQGLAVQLQQSPFLSLVSEERIQATLRLMDRSADSRLTPDLAREICQRTGGAAVLDGSIDLLGTRYVIGLRARTCATGDVLDNEQVQADRKEDVLNALSAVARGFRTRVGESLTTVRAHDRPLEEVTTPSLEALKAYSAALKVLISVNDLPAALGLFGRAIEIDPQFAMAHAMIGFTYGLIGERTLAAASNAIAFQLRDRASDRERFFITANYDLQVTGNLERARQTCELWLRTYPRDIVPHTLLGAFIYPPSGLYEKALMEATIQNDLDPDFAAGYLELAFNNQFLGRLDEAERALQRAAERTLEIPDFTLQRLDIAFLRRDSAAIEREIARGRGQPGIEDWVTDRQAFMLAYGGKANEARATLRRAVDLAQQVGKREISALYLAGGAVWEALFGNASAAESGAAASLELSQSRDVAYGAAFAMALSGDAIRTEALAHDMAARFPDDTFVKASYGPILEALVALNRGEPARAVERLRSAATYDLAMPPCSSPAFFGALYSVYVRGLAFLALRQGSAAVGEFQRILDHGAIVVSDPIGALAHLQMARALALTGDRERSRRAYEEFLALWSEADPEIPILRQARSEFSTLSMN